MKVPDRSHVPTNPGDLVCKEPGAPLSEASTNIDAAQGTRRATYDAAADENASFGVHPRFSNAAHATY